MNTNLQEAQNRLSWVTYYKHYLTHMEHPELYNLFEAEDFYEMGKSPKEAGDIVIERNRVDGAIQFHNELNEDAEETNQME